MMSRTNRPPNNEIAKSIRKGIRGVWKWSSGEKLLYPFSDYIMLAFQESSCLSIWNDQQNPKLIFTSFRDPYELSKHLHDKPLTQGSHLSIPEECRVQLSNIKDRDYFATIHDVRVKGFISNSEKARLLNEIFFGKDSEKDLQFGFWDSLKSAIDTFNLERLTTKKRDQVPGDLSENQTTNLLDPMRKLLDNVFKEIREHKGLSVQASSNTRILNLFTVVRTVRSNLIRFEEFPYTASLLLSNSQKEQLPEICNIHKFKKRKDCQFRECNERCADALEFPLGKDSRSIYDSVFYSGCVDYGLSGYTGEAGRWRDQAGPDKYDKLRQEVEKCVYRTITENSHSRIIYVPIHVGGSPWLAFFTLTKIDDPASWDDNYEFYRDIIPRLSERICYGAQKIYIECLSNEFKAVLRSRPADVCSEINKRWRIISQIYPFEQYSLKILTANARINDSSINLSLPRELSVSLNKIENPFCPKQIEYGDVDPRNVIEQLNRDMLELKGLELLSDNMVRDRLEEQSHTIMNTHPKGLLEIAIDTEDIEKARKLTLDAIKLTEISEVAFNIALRNKLPVGIPHSPVGILKWLKDRILSIGSEVNLEIDENCHHKTIPPEKASSAFTILWNLWSNAAKKTRANSKTLFKVSVQLSKNNDGIDIYFENEGVMSHEWKNYLLGESPSPNPREDRSGLEIVKSKLNDLSWSLREIKIIESKKTLIKLHIPNN